MKLGRKFTGAKYHSARKKKFHEAKRDARQVVLGDTKRKKLRVRGGSEKVVLLRANTVNLITDKGKAKTAEIKNVIETPQNRFLARQNRLAKGVIIDTTLGKAKITNRPSQEGMVNAILIKE